MKQNLAALTILVPAILWSAPAVSAGGPAAVSSAASSHTSLVPVVIGNSALRAVIAQASGSSDALVMLLDQFRDMREELTTLRGLVEEQSYEIRRLQRESLDRYTDLDARITALTQNLQQGAPNGTNSSVQRDAPDAGSTIDGGRNGAGSANSDSVPAGFQAPARTAALNNNLNAAGQQPAVVLTEQQLYQVALDSLLQNQAYERSITEFNDYLADYPGGRFVTNAHYWKGQAYLNLSRLTDARDSFEVILNSYPNGRKADDAMYSLATVYDKLGDPRRARELLQSVMSKYPNTSAANLADIYIRTLD